VGAYRVEVREIGGRKVTVFDQLLDEDTSVATIIVRSSTENVLNDVERALDDGIHAVKTIFQDPRLLPGAGATELELARQLKQYADEDQGLDQYAIRKFAEAFDVVPRTLAENSGCDATNIMHALHVSHHPSSGHEQPAHMGFDIDECKPLDAVKAGIFDVYAAKANALRLAVDAAITVLKVDQIIMAKPAGGPKPRSGPNDPDDA
jgi:T-complex protein 1 subunit theta